MDEPKKPISEMEKCQVKVVSVEKRDEMKEKWEALKVAEVDLSLRRVRLLAEQMELVCEAMRDFGIEI